MGYEAHINHSDRIKKLINEGIFESDKLIASIQKILMPFREIESFQTSLDTEKGRINFKKKIESILRKAELSGMDIKEFIQSGECNDLNRIELVLNESDLYHNKMFFKCLDEILGDLDNLGIYMLEDPRTELVRRPNGYSSNHLVFQLPNGQTLEIQVLPEGTYYGKKVEDDKCYRPAQNICSQLTEFQTPDPRTGKTPELKPSAFYELFSHGNNNEQIMESLNIENDQHVKELINNIHLIFIQSKKYYRSTEETFKFDAKLQNRINRYSEYSKELNAKKKQKTTQNRLLEARNYSSMKTYTEEELYALCHS
jgi:hypothetical protein